MSYPSDRTEIPLPELVQELSEIVRIRTALHEQGKCTYCGRVYDSSPCKLPLRHSGEQL
jgi:hypothetical protein